MVSRLENLIENRPANLFSDHKRRFFALPYLFIWLLGRQLTHRKSLSICGLSSLKFRKRHRDGYQPSPKDQNDCMSYFLMHTSLYTRPRAKILKEIRGSNGFPNKSLKLHSVSPMDRRCMHYTCLYTSQCQNYHPIS
jgi:hypothetical protein